MTIHARIPKPAEPFGPPTAFVRDVLDGLSAEQKRIPPKYFYDERGSKLFEAITALPEYYPTRTELGILTDHAEAIARHIPRGAAMIEFGSGSSIKIRKVLRAASAVTAYVPVDISGEFLVNEAASLKRDFPDLEVLPVAADFTAPFDLPLAVRGKPRVGFFPGSTIGNFEPHEAAAFLRFAAQLLEPGAVLILGVDLVKSPAVLNRAYNDTAGTTAQFNLNLLHRINRELGADFALDAFRHQAFYNREQRRIEMHLASTTRQKVRLCGRTFGFRRGETIHTENSYKFTVEQMVALAGGAGWRGAEVWLDRDRYFSVHALVCEGAPPGA